jgi:hypothetical protein
MQLEKYEIRTEVEGLKYFFSSVGKDIIEKVVEYQKLSQYDIFNLGLPSQLEVYNLAFGDRIVGTKDYSDQTTSNNGDTDKVLATVADSAFEFWEHFPNAVILFQGSNPESQEGLRTYLYQKKIERFMEEIREVALIYGMFNSQFEEFEIGKKYSGFLIIRKR